MEHGKPTDGPTNTQFEENTNKGKRHVRAKFQIIPSLSHRSASVSLRLSLRLSQTRPHPSKWATEGQPITRQTPDSRRSQTRVNDTSVPSFESFRLSRGVPGPSHSVSPRHAPRHAPTPVNGRQRDDGRSEGPQIWRDHKRG